MQDGEVRHRVVFFVCHCSWCLLAKIQKISNLRCFIHHGIVDCKLHTVECHNLVFTVVLHTQTTISLYVILHVSMGLTKTCLNYNRNCTYIGSSVGSVIDAISVLIIACVSLSFSMYSQGNLCIFECHTCGFHMYNFMIYTSKC